MAGADQTLDDRPAHLPDPDDSDPHRYILLHVSPCVRLPGVLQTGGDAVHGEQKKLLHPTLIRVGCRAAAKRSQRTELEVAERIDVGIAQLDGPGEHAALLEQTGLIGDREDALPSSVVLGQDQIGDARLTAEAQIVGCHEAIGLGEAHLGVVDQDVQQRPFGICNPELLERCRLQRAAEAVPTGKVEPDLRPGQDPGNRTQ